MMRNLLVAGSVMTAIIPVILAGGSGTRLWPLSRKNFPKQFLHLHGEKSLLQQTVDRIMVLDAEQVFIISNEAHYFLCQEQLNNHSVKPHYLLEPCARNTAPAIASAAHLIARRYGEDAVMLILPSDHFIASPKAWCEAMQQGIHSAIAQKKLVTFGIEPTSPKTGYGYIEASDAIDEHARRVESFREKPNVEMAQSFLASGNYFWNSGMFAGTIKLWLDELKHHAPDIYQSCQLAVEKSQTSNDFMRLDQSAFSSCPSDSIDYAVFEKTNNVSVIPTAIDWNDLGCWSAVAESNQLDQNGNALSGNVIAKDSTDCLVSSEKTLVTTLGINNQIIVATGDAVLVADKSYSQQVKDIVSSLGNEHRQLANDHLKVSRPWGYYEVLAEGDIFKVKRLMVKPGAKLSLQMHQHRAEHWVVVSGNAEVVNDQQSFLLQTNQSTYIPPKTLHRLSNPGVEPLYVIEVQSGEYLGEDDIKRFDDDYMRLTEAVIS